MLLLFLLSDVIALFCLQRWLPPDRGADLATPIVQLRLDKALHWRQPLPCRSRSLTGLSRRLYTGGNYDSFGDGYNGVFT
jgi:hypothetical protein